MTAEEINRTYVNVPRMADELGVNQHVIHNWFNRRKLPDSENVLGRPCLKRETFEAWKREHPELVKTAPTSAEVTI